jgi:hypothetical protein
MKKSTLSWVHLTTSVCVGHSHIHVHCRMLGTPSFCRFQDFVCGGRRIFKTSLIFNRVLSLVSSWNPLKLVYNLIFAFISFLTMGNFTFTCMFICLCSWTVRSLSCLLTNQYLVSTQCLVHSKHSVKCKVKVPCVICIAVALSV